MSSTRQNMTTRTCAGCRETFPQHDLVRLALVDHEPFAAPDLGRKLPGRGVWIFPHPQCIERAVKGQAVSRALRRKVRLDGTALRMNMAQQFKRRAYGLLQGARSSGNLILGRDMVQEALDDGRVSLVLVAEDAAERGDWERMVDVKNSLQDESAECVDESGNKFSSKKVSFLVWQNKKELGSQMGRAESAVLALGDEGIARELESCVIREQTLSLVKDLAPGCRRSDT